MMADLTFPADTRRGGLLGWFGPKQSDIDRINQARMAANLAKAAGMSDEEILDRWGADLGVGDVGPFKEAARGRAAALGTAVQRMSPSGTVENPSQLGPVLQEPGWDWQSFIPPPAADITAPVPSRATFGAEQLFPDASMATTPEGAPVNYPSNSLMGAYEAAYGPSGVLRRRGVEEDVAPYSPAAAVMEGEPGGATAYAQPEMPPPDYLQYPGYAAPAPDPFRPGGERGVRPGLTLAELVTQDPQMSALLLRGDLDKFYATQAKAGTAEDEADSRKATQEFNREVAKTGNREAALEKYESRMAKGKVGQEVLAQQGKAEERGKKILERRTEQDLRNFALKKADELRESNPEEARRWEARARGGKDALSLIEKVWDDEMKQQEFAAKREDAAAKAAEAKKPTVIDDVPYTWQTDPETGEQVFKVAPGWKGAEKPWWDGKTEPQIAAISNDMNQPPEVREAARKTLADLATQKKAGATSVNVKMTAGEKEDWASDLMVLDVVDRIDASLPKQLKNIGGPFGLKAKINAVFSTAGWGPEGFAAFRSNAQKLRAKLSHDLAGANVPAGERKLYLMDIPDVDNDSVEQFLAKYNNLKMNLTNFMNYRRRLDEGERNIPIPEPAGGRNLKSTPTDPLNLFPPNDPRRNVQPRAPSQPRPRPNPALVQ